MRNVIAAPFALLLAAGLLAGCGTRTEDRALSGAGIGAAAGLAVGAVTGLTLLQGAAIGAAVGGVTGAVTDSKDVDLGTPAWRGSAAPANQPPPSAQAPGNLVWRTQTALSARGYDVGPVDGVLGQRTRTAIERYQAQNGLPVDGLPSDPLVRHIEGRS